MTKKRRSSKVSSEKKELNFSTKFTADFETTTDENDCRVWAWAICSIEDHNNIVYGNDIKTFIDYIANYGKNITLYFHNLKFDGDFICNYLCKIGFTAVTDLTEVEDYTFIPTITDRNVWYSLKIYFPRKGKRRQIVTIRDSFKILSFSVAKIAKDFELPIRKGEIDYHAYREVGHELTEEELAYLRNDVEIMSMALRKMFEQGLTASTIASDALQNFKLRTPQFKHLFPVLDADSDSYIRQSYKGGFTYLSPKYKEKETGSGVVLDVNSLYPSRMMFELLPYGVPVYFDGKYKPDEEYPLYIQRFTCCFKIKPDKIPSIQIKNSPFPFDGKEYLESSRGNLVTLTLTNPDLELFFDQYDVEDLTFEDGFKFKGRTGIFNDYIETWTKSKIEAKKAHNSSLYLISKLMLNSLYGKFATSTINNVKLPILVTDGIKYELKTLPPKKPIYTAMASFITAYARRYTITTSQIIRDYSMQNLGYDAYVYSDTDSIHALVSKSDLEQLKDFIEIDPFKLGAWDLEAEFSHGKYLRQKCYIERIDDEIKVTVAGLPRDLHPIINFDNFKIGFTSATYDPKKYNYKPKKRFKHVDGGVVLVDVDFTIK